MEVQTCTIRQRPRQKCGKSTWPSTGGAQPCCWEPTLCGPTLQEGKMFFFAAHLPNARRKGRESRMAAGFHPKKRLTIDWASSSQESKNDETTSQSCTDSVVPLIPIVLNPLKRHTSSCGSEMFGLCGCCFPTGHRGTLLVQFGDRFPGTELATAGGQLSDVITFEVCRSMEFILVGY